MSRWRRKSCGGCQRLKTAQRRAAGAIWEEKRHYEGYKSLLLLLNRWRQLEGRRRLAAPLQRLCLQTFYRLIGNVAASQRGRMNAGAMEVATTSGNEAILVSQCTQFALILWRIGTIVGL